MSDDRDKSLQERMDKAVESVRQWSHENEIVQVCDFCVRPVKRGEGATFLVDSPFANGVSTIDVNTLDAATALFGYSPDWLACDVCAKVIEEGDPDKLADHVHAYYDRKRVGQTHAGYRDELADLYQRFYAGNPRRVA